MRSDGLAQEHWNKTPLLLSEESRYGKYPWLAAAAEFAQHAGHDVLEIGCGTGSDLLQFARNGARAVGIDITNRHLELARQRVGDSARVMKGSGTSIPFPDDSFDYVYSHGVLHHIEQPQLVASEILRVLRPGGRFNIHVYARYSWTTCRLVARRPRQWKLYIENSPDPVHIELYTARKLKRLFPGIPLRFEKHQWGSRPEKGRFERWFGWFLVCRGEKPQVAVRSRR